MNTGNLQRPAYVPPPVRVLVTVCTEYGEVLDQFYVMKGTQSPICPTIALAHNLRSAIEMHYETEDK